MKKLAAVVGMISALFALLGVVGTSTEAAAQTKGSCCVHTTSKLDDLLNPVKGGDEKFFTSTVSGLPNVSLIVDNSGSMLDWPFPLCYRDGDEDYNDTYANQGYSDTTGGCNCPGLNNLGYDKTVQYEPELKQINSNGSNGFWDEWFDRTDFYSVKPRRDQSYSGSAYGKESYGVGAPANNFSPAGNLGNNRGTACSTSSNPSKCDSCVRDRGYYFDKVSTKDVMSGNFLNFFSPKFLTARRVLKQVVREIRPVRMQILAFGQRTANNPSNTIEPDDYDRTKYVGPPQLVQAYNPGCDHPANSNFDSNRQSFMSSLDSIRYTFPYTPLTRSLFMAGYSWQWNSASPNNLYENKFGSTWFTPLGWDSTFAATFAEDTNASKKSICNSCIYSANIIITDGLPNDAMPGGGHYETVPTNVGADIPVPGCTFSNGFDLCAFSKLDEVARFQQRTDMRLDHDGTQRVATYTLGFGLSSASTALKLLRSAADNGGGDFFKANNGTELKSRLLNIFEAINTRNTAFSSSNVASLQTADTRLSAIVPRMSPSGNSPWLGQLYRFEQYNEFVQDTDIDGDPDGGAGYKSEIFMRDSDGDIIIEDDTGAFVKRTNQNQLAKPMWEAAKVLTDTTGYANRKIYTVVDSNDDGRFTEGDTEVEFTPANADLLLPYLGLAEPGVCPTVSTGDIGSLLSKIQPIPEVVSALCGAGFDAGFPSTSDGGAFAMSQQDATRCCAKVVIDWVRGRDLTTVANATRPDVLGDIFHSSPVQVDPPTPRFLCDLGISNQCVRTLYSQQLGVTATPLATYPAVNDVCSTGVNDAYDEYIRLNRTRDRLVVVGANDGMLHAFHNGNGALATITDGGTACLNGIPSVNYDVGTGVEVWAFIPPDQLPRIHERILRHTYYIDGDTMVRDIWADTAGSGTTGTKDHTVTNPEYKTMVISSEGRGGNHYFALEAKFDSAGNALAPDFRWIFPQPCSQESMTMGKTLYALAPKPPPIGPVLIRGDVTPVAGGGTTVSATGGVANRYGGTTERWVAALSGGWSPALDKGRGVYVVDAWTGTVNGRNDNLWWKFEFDDSPPDDNFAPRKFLVNSVAAPIALVDYGENRDPRLDGYFDTGVFGDTAGQLWLMRMFEPATLDSSTKLINNWVAARVFETDNRTAAPSDLLDIGGSGTRPEENRWPFFYLPSTALQQETGALRAFIGSGNRYSVLDEKAGTCRYDNPQACSKYGCSEVKFIEKWEKGAWKVDKNETHWKTVQFEHGKFDNGTQSLLDACGTGSATAKGLWDDRKIDCSGVPVTSGLTLPTSDVGKVAVECGKFGVNGGYYCKRTDTNATNYSDWPLNPAAATLAALGMERFYGMHVYGAGKALSVKSDAGINELPVAFDNLRLTDRGGADGGGNLVDVTATQCTQNGCTGNQAAPSSSGWFLEYPGLSHKTGSGSALLASCVLWSSVYPAAPSDGGCSASVKAGSGFYQADFVTGAPNCAAGFLQDGGFVRSQTRTVLAPPPEPATAIMIGPNGQIRYSALLVEPGQQQAQEVNISGGNDILQSVYELPVSRQLHDCRHSGGSTSGCDVTP